MSYTERQHNRSQIRHNNFKHIKRKEKILKNVYDGGFLYENRHGYGWYYVFTNGQPHRLSKGKIHCSCPMCREKTRELGFKHADKINMQKGYEKIY